jgi:predicted nuclease of predicted toxin-antitoxin system
MKVVLDSCVSFALRVPLEAAGHDVVWIGDWAKDPGDKAILAFAAQNERVVITLDKDFGTLAIRDKQPHTGIIRLVNLSLRHQADVCLEVLRKYENSLVAGAIVTVDQNRLRIRQA